MVKTIIEAFPKEQREARDDGSAIIHVSEMFSDTLQGENFTGFPATFLRLQRCSLNCAWCDTAEVWRQGNPYSVWELVEIFQKSDVASQLKKGQHLVLTGGSPLLQQEALVDFIDIFQEKCGFKPFIEIENEAVIMPLPKMIEYVNLWNNSPKLSNSGNKLALRYKPEVIKVLSAIEASFFKFVVSEEKDWEEIKSDYIHTGLVQLDKIVLMPEGATQAELKENYKAVVDICTRECIRFSDRLHVTIWDKATGV